MGKVDDSLTTGKWELSITIVCMFCILIACGFGVTAAVKYTTREEQNKNMQERCLAHLHQAGKAMHLEEAESQLSIGLVCLQEIKPICADQDFDDKVQRIEEMKNEIHRSYGLSNLEKEALLQKLNRVLFNGGESCYKGQCNHKSTLFICPYLK